MGTEMIWSARTATMRPNCLRGDEVAGGLAEAAGQDAVEGDRRAAALHVPEDRDADLQVDVLLDVGGHLVGDAAEALA